MTRPNCDTLPGLTRSDVVQLFSEAGAALAPYTVVLTEMERDRLVFIPINPESEPELTYCGEAKVWRVSGRLSGRGETATEAMQDAASKLREFSGAGHVGLRDWCRAKVAEERANNHAYARTVNRVELLLEIAEAFGFSIGLETPDHTSELPAVESNL